MEKVQWNSIEKNKMDLNNRKMINHYNNNKHNILVLYKKCKKYNEFQLTKNKMDLNNRKWNIINPPPSEESQPVTDPLGKTVEETGDKLITT